MKPEAARRRVGGEAHVSDLFYVACAIGHWAYSQCAIPQPTANGADPLRKGLTNQGRSGPHRLAQFLMYSVM